MTASRDTRGHSGPLSVLNLLACAACDSYAHLPRFRIGPPCDGKRWLLEIVGFWTPRYLESKLARLARAEIPNLLLCIDAERNCGSAELPRHARVVFYRRRIRTEDVLLALEGDPGST